MNKEYQEAIEREVESWPGATVRFEHGSKHPKAKLTFAPEGGEPMTLSRPFPGTPSDNRGLQNCIADVRRTLRQLGAERAKAAPTKVEEEAFYRKPNDGAAKRPDPFKHEQAKQKPGMAEQLAETHDKAAAQADGSAKTYQIREEMEAVAPKAGARFGSSVAVVAMAAALVACGIDIVVAGDVSMDGLVQTASEMIDDGIYFGLPDTVYHAVPRLSSSGLQKLAVSPATFWRGSWLDPDRPELDEDQTKAQLIGKAYHVARLEPDRFHAAYCRLPGREDFEGDVLTSDNAIKAALKELGEPQTQGNESIADRGRRLLEADYDGTVMAVVLDDFEIKRAGRIALKGETFDEIIRDMDRIRAAGDIAPLLSGGEAEVSIFWTDQHGLKMKARVDYLTALWWVDFKTFDNSRGKELNQALADAMRYNRYYLQGGTYREAIEAVRVQGLQIQSTATDEQRALIAKIQMAPGPLACWFVFQEKTGIPNLLAREFKFNRLDHIRQAEVDAFQPEDGGARARDALAQPTQLYQRALWEADRAKRDFALYSEVYEPGQPWAPINPVGAFDDADFNTYWLEGRS